MRQRLIFVWASGLLVISIGAAALLWWRTPAAPELAARDLLAPAFTTNWSAPLDGLVVVARPAQWARRIADDPRRAPLIDPTWWGSVEASELAGLPVAPSTMTTAVLEAFPTSLAVGWWDHGWQVRGKLRARTTLTAALSAVGRESVEVTTSDGVTQLGPPSQRTAGAWNAPQPTMVDGPLACWVWSGQKHWLGRWRGQTLEVVEPGVAAVLPPRFRAALVVHADNLLTALATVGIEPPRDRWLSIVTGEMETLLARPATLILDRVEAHDPLPKLRFALLLPWWNDRSQVIAVTRSALCPVGARVSEATLDDGRSVERWRSSILSWWASEEDSGLVVASGEEALVTGIAVAKHLPLLPGPWWSADGERLAASLEVIGNASLLSDLGVVSDARRQEIQRLAGPLAGFRQIAWQRTAAGEALHVRLE